MEGMLRKLAKEVRMDMHRHNIYSSWVSLGFSVMCCHPLWEVCQTCQCI